MSASYPSGIYLPRTKANSPGTIFEPENQTRVYVEDVNVLDQEVIAIENALGVNVFGSYDSLVLRLNAADLALAAEVSLREEHSEDVSNPHSVTKAQVGLGAVDNTSDLDKPISTAVSTALNTKLTNSSNTNKLLGRSTAGVGALEEISLGSGLSLSGGILSFTGSGAGDVVGPESTTENYIPQWDSSLKVLKNGLAVPEGGLAGLTSLAEKVDKVTGKSLSTNDYTTTEKDKLAAITGTNTGDETETTIKTKLGITTLSGTNTGDNAVNSLYSGLATSKQDALGFTPENVSNKSTNVAADSSSDIKYPSVKAIKDYADSLVAGLLDYRGGYNASGNVYPSTGGSGSAGAVLKGDMWIVSVAGVLGSVAVQVGDSVIANTDAPGQTAGNWNILNANISYVPEDAANKVTSISGSSTDVQYPSAKLLYDQLALYVTKSLFDANSLLYATADNTPLALTIGASTLVGRKATGDISALTASEVRTIINVADGATANTKATGAEVDTGTDDAKFVTPKAVADSKIVLTDKTQTLSNKKITKRVVTTTDDATAVIDVDVTDVYELTAMANATTISTTGTPTDGQIILIRLKDNGTARALTWDAAFVAIGITLPTTTVLGKWHYILTQYNSAAAKWHALAATVQA